MRNLFSKFFRSKINKAEVELPSILTSNEKSILTDTPISRDLFIDEENPSTDAPKKKVWPSMVSSFLQKDHFSYGVEEGYNQHSAEFLRKQINAMASTFRRLLSEDSDEHRRSITELKMNLAQIGNKFPEIEQQLIIRIEEHQIQIDSYQNEEQNSIELEGMIGSSVKAYEAGYEMGLRQYLEEKGFLNSFTL